MMVFKNSDIVSINNSTNLFLINWHVTGWCNFHCPFCYAEPLRTKWLDENVVYNNAKLLNNFILDKLYDKDICLRLVGGEISFYDIPKIINNITAKQLKKVILITNFSRDVDYYKDLELYFASRDIQFILICSLHDEAINFKSKFLELFNWCEERRNEIRKTFDPLKYKKFQAPQVTLVVTPDFNLNTYYDFKKSGIDRIRLTRVRGEGCRNEKLSDELLKFIEDANKDYESNYSNIKGRAFNVTFNSGEVKSFTSASNLTNFLDEDGFIPDNYYCSAGLNSLAIFPNGDVSLARCDYLKDKFIGNLKEYQNIKLPTEPVLCKLNNSDTYDKRCDLCSDTNIWRTNDKV